MKKVIFLVIATIFLNGCFQVLALVGPAATGAASGNIYQSAISYSFSYGVKKTTGKTVIENVIDLNKDFKRKEEMAKNRANKDLINSFYPRTFPGTLKSTYIF
jgi:outer membrane lipoprotein-sorting protein